jgi:NTP pyrophosphatase (non-canonical NTP hydrolase)
MTFNEYSVAALKSADYPNMNANLIYPALGLAGEAGEFAEKVKKNWRNKGSMSALNLSPEQRTEFLKEIGDCLWYCAAACEELGYSLDAAAEANIYKLRDRAARGVIKSEGDNR